MLRRLISTALISLFTLASSQLAFSASSVLAGAVCKTFNQTKVYQNKKFTCLKSGKKLVWSRGVALPEPIVNPTPTPTPTPVNTSTSTPEPFSTEHPIGKYGLDVINVQQGGKLLDNFIKDARYLRYYAVSGDGRYAVFNVYTENFDGCRGQCLVFHDLQTGRNLMRENILVNSSIAVSLMAGMLCATIPPGEGSTPGLPGLALADLLFCTERSFE